MGFPTRLLIVGTATVVVAVAVIGVLAAGVMRDVFDDLGQRQRQALFTQFRKQFRDRGEDVQQRLRAVRTSDSLDRILTALRNPDADLAPFASAAAVQARREELDFLELVASDGRIVSSARGPGRDSAESWVTAPVDWKREPAFLREEQLTGEPVLALVAVETVDSGDKPFYLVGGVRLDDQFLNSLPVSADLRTSLVRATAADDDAHWPVLRELADAVHRERNSITRRIRLEDESSWTYQGFPLDGRDGRMLGVLLVGSASPELDKLTQFLIWMSFGVALAGLGFGLLVSSWGTARISRPLAHVGEGTRAVAAGNFDYRVPVEGETEVATLAASFNEMADQLGRQRHRLQEAARIAAMRQFASDVVNLWEGARVGPTSGEQPSGAENTEAWNEHLQELRKLASMPAPSPEPLDLRDVVEQAALRVQSEEHDGWPSFRVNLSLPSESIPAFADPGLLAAALDLLLRAAAAETGSGALTLAAGGSQTTAWIEVSASDSAHGPAQDARPPFRSTLGLARAHALALDLDGSLQVIGHAVGTLYRMEIPAASKGPVAVPETNREA